MAGRIVPIALTASQARVELERVWSDGDVALLLPADDPGRGLPDRVGPGADASAALPDDAAAIVMTSGSTGDPRGVVLTHGALEAAVDASNARIGCRPGDRWALALPLHHVAGLMVVLRSRALGTDAVALAHGRDAHVALVPTQLARLLRADADLSRFATILVGGGPAPEGLLDAARAAGGRVVASYGMTETCGGCVHDGLPLDGVEVALGSGGRIRLRGPVLAAGYLGAPDVDDDGGGFGPDGWFVTSDRGRLEDGRLVVEGRADDLIITGGAKVAPVAVVRALLTHPGVEDAVVVGVDDPEWGQRVRAVVVPSPGVEPPRLEALRAHVRRSMPTTAAPTELLVVASLPRDGLGKVTAARRRELAALDPTERRA
jgi:O-succinylbenzoic acid--CoA ligase